MRLTGSKKNRGFTILEVILSMLIMSLVLGVASEVMLKQADAYSLVNNRKSALQDTRYALFHIKTELEKMDSSDLQTISSTALSFYDDAGTLRTYSLGSSGGSLGIFAGSQLVVGRLHDFWIDYFDGAGAALPPTPGTVALVRRMIFNLQTEPQDGEGQITLTMQIIPRDFLGYTNFE
jgi:prepilin-type N-terminal cleavage/methylation domain-containing protein